MRSIIVAIDGPAGVGKSTVAKALATRLGYLYLDTGALYRAVAWKVRDAQIDSSDHASVRRLLDGTKIAMEPLPGSYTVQVDGRDITNDLRAPEISRLASIVSAIPAVREWLLPLQRTIGGRGGIVAEGRDIGTRVFPAADVKFFLDADADIRAARRHRELVAAGEGGGLERTRAEMEGRDARDRTRAIAPLTPASDAERIDTSAIGIEQVLERMLAVIASKL